MSHTHEAVERYLADVEQRLPGGAKLRAEVIDEIRGGLDDALEEAGAESGHDVEVVLREFGEPPALASALGAEIRMRLARRGAWQVAVVLALMAVGWQIYAAAVGTPESMIPAGWQSSVFLLGVKVMTSAPFVAQICALAMITVTSARILGRVAGRVLPALALVTMLATAAFGVAMVAMVLTVAAEHRAETFVVGLACAAGLTVVSWGAARALRHAGAPSLIQGRG